MGQDAYDGHHAASNSNSNSTSLPDSFPDFVQGGGEEVTPDPDEIRRLGPIGHRHGDPNHNVTQCHTHTQQSHLPIRYSSVVYKCLKDAA